MKTQKILKEDLLDLNGYLTMVETFEEIAALRMRKVKKTVLSRREFLKGINEAFSYIIYAYSAYKKSMGNRTSTNILNTNGRKVLVLLSSNTGLYGDIILKVFTMFADEVKRSDSNTDVVITGRLGKRFYDNSDLKKDYKFFEVSDNGSSTSDVRELLEFLTNYTEVIVCHGVFNNIMSQEAQHTHLTGEVIAIEKSLEGLQVKFIFEPNVEKVTEYFEKQILSLIFEQSLFESGLSKFAARMVSLDDAVSNINQKIYMAGFELKKANHRDRIKNILSTISGGDLWMQ